MVVSCESRAGALTTEPVILAKCSEPAKEGKEGLITVEGTNFDCARKRSVDLVEVAIKKFDLWAGVVLGLFKYPCIEYGKCVGRLLIGLAFFLPMGSLTLRALQMAVVETDGEVHDDVHF